MPDPIRRLTTWAVLMLKPSGSHRRLTRRRPQSAPAIPQSPPATPLPPHRSPYSRDNTPLDATTNRSVRPYLTAHEQRQRRRERPYWIHGLEVA